MWDTGRAANPGVWCPTKTGTVMSDLAPGARLLGVLFLVPGLALVVIGLVDFFSSAFSDEFSDEPTKFWMAFAGMPLVFVGLACLIFGFAGAGLKYAAGETVPVLKDAMDQLGLQGGARRSPGDGPYCRSCGTQNDAAARFCDSCGASMSA
jgi:uncharacterized membrane protein